MSSESPPGKPKNMRTVYSREFLISVGESDRCKHLPPGVDLSLLNELQVASSVAFEKSNNNKGPYATPLGRADGSGGYTYSSRGGSSGGRWDTRSTGSSDREGDLPDRELLAQDRRNGNQYKRTWQNTEHDGLLGSGGFPRPPGYAGQLAPKDRGNVPQPNRTSERYQPPRPYKAGPPTRKDVDSMNDETFGSLECSNDDRAEEEKKRRASFELMRKEQHKSLQEKKSGPDAEKGNTGGDIMSMLQNSTESLGSRTNTGKPDGRVASSVYQEDTTKTPSILPAPAARPLVPPGFSNAFVEKKVQSQTSNIALEPKVHAAARVDKMPSINQSAAEPTAGNRNEKGISDKIGVHQKYTLPSGGISSSTEFASNILKGTEDWEVDAMDKYSIEKQSMPKNSGSVGKDSSISILEEFFGNTLSKSGGNLPTYIESQQLNTGADIMVSSVPESSKFARWFRDEDSKPSEDLSSKSLFSMIVNNETPGPQNIAPGPQNIAPGPSLSDGAIQNLSSKLPTDKFDASSKLPSFTSPAPAGGIREQHSHGGIPEPVPVMMTCEDLEQAMLAQVGSSSSTQKNDVHRHHAVLDEPTAKQKVAVDSHASHPLLSLLQKGTDNKGSSPFGFHIGSATEPQSSDVNVMTNSRTSGTIPINKTETAPASGKSVTLEALFGAAFMNELHSTDAPVSIRGSGSSHEGYYPGEEARLFNNNENGAAPKEARTGIEYQNPSFSGPSQGTNFDRKSSEIYLPEEDSLFTMNDPFGARKPDILPSLRSSRVEVQNPERAVDDLNYKLQSLVSGDVEHRQVLGPDALGSHPREQRFQTESQNLYHLLQGRQPALGPRPMLDHAGSRSQQGPFDMPQAMRHDPRRSFPANMNPMQHTLNAPGVPLVDPPAHHPMLQRMPGSFPAEGLPRGVLPSQPMHQVAGYRPEMNNVNNFHMHSRQPNYGDFGLMPPGPSGPAVRGNHPDSLERLMQMELTARSKQIHPAMAGPVPSGSIYGSELDMNSGYR